MKTIMYLFVATAMGCFLAAGCDSGANKTADSNNASSDHDHDHGDHDHDHGDHDHDHGDHDHSHDNMHGPNGGHIFTFEPATYKGEWKHYNDNHVIEVYVLDANGKTNQAIKAESVTISRTTGDDKTKFTLDPKDAGEDGKTAVYSLDSQPLAIAMNLGVTVEMKVGDETFTVDIPPHEPHDH